MESPTMVAVPVEEMARYLTPAVYEVPYTQNNGTNYPDWGNNASYGENRRRNPRGKPHHQNRRSQQQAWSPECGPAASPQWQPQPPPPPPPPPLADASFSAGFQEQQGPVAVNLQGLPSTLCRQPFLEAMLDQAGLADEIMGCVLGEDQDTGKAVIYLANYNAAVKCVQHFGGRRWANSGPPVTAQVAEGQGPPVANTEPQTRAGNTNTRKAPSVKNSPQQMTQLAMPPPAMPGAWVLPQPALPIMIVQPYYKGSDMSLPMHAGGDSPNSGRSGSDSPKVRWADVGEQDQEHHSEGHEGSTSAGSTGRSGGNVGEPFFFGCDVDTDDGF